MEWIEPDWPAPAQVRALCTTRNGGSSTGAFESFNLADHVGDDPSSVGRNRALLRDRLGLPSDPHWLSQVHGCDVADTVSDPPECPADAAVSMGPGRVCAVMTADCLPLLLCDEAGTRVAAIHAGWRGLAKGVIEAAVVQLAVPPPEVLCWFGPAIGPLAFEVGGEVREHFMERGGEAAEAAFRPTSGEKWLADLYALARQRLQGCGIDRIWGGEHCTYCDPARFFSYRRDGVTGRMASLIWIEQNTS